MRKRCQKCGGNPNHFCDCHQGYKGRVGVYQFLQPQSSYPQGYTMDFDDLRQSALEKIKNGITDLAEIQRVLGQTYD